MRIGKTGSERYGSSTLLFTHGMAEELDWLAEYDQDAEDYAPFQIAHPEKVRVFLLFMDPGYKLDRVSRRQGLLEAGVLTNEAMRGLAPVKVSATEGDYTKMGTFYFATDLQEEPTQNQTVWGRIEEPLTGFEVVFPKSVQAMHTLNAVYVMYQRSCLKRPNPAKTRRKVHFKTSLSKTRRAIACKSETA